MQCKHGVQSVESRHRLRLLIHQQHTDRHRPSCMRWDLRASLLACAGAVCASTTSLACRRRRNHVSRPTASRSASRAARPEATATPVMHLPEHHEPEVSADCRGACLRPGAAVCPTCWGTCGHAQLCSASCVCSGSTYNTQHAVIHSMQVLCSPPWAFIRNLKPLSASESTWSRRVRLSVDQTQEYHAHRPHHTLERLLHGGIHRL